MIEEVLICFAFLSLLFQYLILRTTPEFIKALIDVTILEIKTFLLKKNILDNFIGVL